MDWTVWMTGLGDPKHKQRYWKERRGFPKEPLHQRQEPASSPVGFISGFCKHSDLQTYSPPSPFQRC